MKKIGSLIVLCLFTYSVGLGQTGNIKGNIQDNSTLNPIEFATISVYNEVDSQLVTGTIADANGQYSVEKLPYNNYYLKIDFIGYNSVVVPNVEVNKKETIIPPVSLSISSQVLEEMNVVEEKALFETKIDKKVFNADKSIISKGGNALDLLKDVPSVEVDENDNIKLRGDANVNILIDGRPSSMPISQLLKQVPASAIEKVEIITNPSAKYDPEGMSGILNIIMKKNRLQGFNATVNSGFTYGKKLRNNSSLGINYRKNKINVYTNLSGNYANYHYEGFHDRNVLLYDTLNSRLLSEDNGYYLSRSYSITGGMDYFVNDFNTVYFSSTYNFDNGYNNRTIDYSNYVGSELINTSERKAESDMPNGGYNFNGGWQKTFKKNKSTLDIDINYSTNTKDADELFTEHFYTPTFNPLGLPAYQAINQNNKNNVLLSKIDFVLPINDSMQIEMGTHYTSRSFDNLYYSESKTGNGSYVADTALNNNFKYVQDVIAGYFTYSHQIKKIGIKAGIRAEQTFTTSELITTAEEFRNDYFELFPSVHLSYELQPQNEFTLSYSKRINRPAMQMLNPFSSYSDPYTLERGNPFLQPEIIHVNELGYSRFWKKFNLNATIYYRHINNMSRKYLSNENEISVVSYTNLGSSSLSGGELILGYTPKKTIRVNSVFNIWNSTITDPLVTNNKTTNAIGISERLSVTISMKKGVTVQIAGDYRPKLEVQQGTISEMYGVGAAIQKSILKRKGSISLRVSDIFNTREFDFTSYDLNNYTFISHREWESQTVTFNFSYTFGKLTRGKRKRTVKKNDIGDNKNVPGM